MITSFRGPHRFLSNFWAVPIRGAGCLTFPSVENAYHAEKAALDEDHFRFQECSASQAKRLGRQIKIRPDWDQVKLEVMARLVTRKFMGPRPEHQALAIKLLSTEEERLIEGNTWGDQFWGCTWCPDRGMWVGDNHLGQILMTVRSKLRKDANR